MLILLDMDGVLADFDAGFYKAWQEQFANLYPPIEKSARRAFYVKEDYPAEMQDKVVSIYNARYFYRNLPVMQGAKEAVNCLQNDGHEVRICTSPLITNRYCPTEKFEWVEEHFGSEFLSRIIISKDKTWVRGDILIDDKPLIKGYLKSEWQHVIYDHPYNQEAPGIRLTWNNYQTVIANLMIGEKR